MNVQTNRRAIVIGGSLGGLFTATALRATGWEVEVYERSPHELDSRGGGIVLQNDVLAAFHFASISAPIVAGVQSSDRIYLDRKDNVLHRFFMPQTQTSWGTIYNLLKQALPKEVIHPGKKLSGLSQVGQSVLATFTDGEQVTGDLLIGADGAHSTVRQQFFPLLAPKYAGYIAWRGLVAEKAIRPPYAALLDKSFSFLQGQGHLMLAYLVPGENGSTNEGERRWNWVWYRRVVEQALLPLLKDREGKQHGFTLPPGTIQEEFAEKLRAEAKLFLGPSFQELVDSTEQPFVQAILDLQVPQMVFGRVALVGDAAFIPRPHTAGSAAKAALNAVSLAQALEQQDFYGSLQQWQRRQLLAGQKLVNSGISMGNQIMGLPSL